MNGQRFRTLNTTIAVLAVFCIAAIGWSIFVYFNARPNPVSSPLLYNAYFPDDIHDNSIRYYNGNTFLQYDLATQKISHLVPDPLFHIEDLRNVFWLKGGVVFNVSTIPSWSPLYAEFTTKINPPLDPQLADIADSDVTAPDEVYWFMSFSDGKITPLTYPVSLTASQFAQYTNDNQLVFWDATNGYMTINGNGDVNPGIAAGGNTINPQSSYILAMDGATVSYLHLDGRVVSLRKLDRKTNQSTVLNSNLFTVTKSQLTLNSAVIDNTRILITTPLEAMTSRELILLNLSNGQKKILANNYGGSLRHQHPLPIIVADTTRVYLYGLIGDTPSLERHIDDISSDPTAAWCKEKLCYLHESSGIIRVIADSDVDLPHNMSPSGSIEKALTTDTVSVTRNVSSIHDNEYIVTFISGTPQEAYRSVQAAAEKNNINPDLYTFILNPGRGAQY